MAFKMKGSPHKMGTIKGSSGHASALKHKKDGSWRGHEHKSLLGKLTGVVAEGIGGIKDRRKDYKANKKTGESRRDFNIRRKAESEEKVKNVEEIKDKEVVVEEKVVSTKEIKEEIPRTGLNAGGDDWTGTDDWTSLSQEEQNEENRIWGERNPDLTKKDILSGELTLQENPWLVNLSFVNTDGTIREPGNDDRFTSETQKTGTSEGTEYGIGEWKDFNYIKQNE